LTGVVEPVPAEINQVDRQYLKWTGTQYSRSAYETGKQKTKIKLINNEVPDYTQLEPKSDGSSDPAKLGSTITYGPYEEVTPAQLGGDVISLRYEYTLPVITADTFSREIEVSHWGGNLAIEEKYALTNTGAKLKDNFNRVKWTATNYLNPPTAAIKSLTYGLTNFPLNPYYTDEIGNVSTSRFRQEQKPGEAHLELKPRYPLFGGWNYTYTLGWNHDLRNFVRQRGSSGNYVLRVPFMEGPKEPMVYKDVSVTVILPEGAT
jgi:oligosaccharyltransferase complex subunit alpha (ribophorin I)